MNLFEAHYFIGSNNNENFVLKMHEMFHFNDDDDGLYHVAKKDKKKNKMVSSSSIIIIINKKFTLSFLSDSTFHITKKKKNLFEFTFMIAKAIGVGKN